MTELEKLFAEKRTENGDIAYNTTGDNLLDILFMTEYYNIMVFILPMVVQILFQ